MKHTGVSAIALVPVLVMTGACGASDEPTDSESAGLSPAGDESSGASDGRGAASDAPDPAGRTGTPEQPASDEAAPAGGGCDGVVAAMQRIEALDIDGAKDAGDLPATYAELADVLTAAEVPEAVAADWASVTDVVVAQADALRNVDGGDEAALFAAIALAEVTEAQLAESEAAGVRVEEYVATECGVEVSLD